jgi:hypothetical protein
MGSGQVDATVQVDRMAEVDDEEQSLGSVGGRYRSPLQREHLLLPGAIADVL